MRGRVGCRWAGAWKAWLVAPGRQVVGIFDDGSATISNGTADSPRAEKHSSKRIGFRVFTLDDLFRTQWGAERLGFAHLDLEGSESAALRGAEATIWRDRPVLTTEAQMNTQPAKTGELLLLLERLGYDTHVVDEECGVPRGCRNMISLPRGRAPEGAAIAQAWLRAQIDEGIVSAAVDVRTYPCCQAAVRGGGDAPCCPPTWSESAANQCCSMSAVYRWAGFRREQQRQQQQQSRPS